MELALIFIGLPVVTYLGLALLPRGKAARYGIGLAAASLAALWLSVGMGSSDSYLVALIGFLVCATVLATIVQLLRRAMGTGRPGWVYPAVVFGALVAAGIPMLTVLGV